MVCAIKGYRFTPISSDGFSDEKLRTMRLFGGDLEIFPAAGGKLVPELYQRMKRRAEELAQEPGTFYTNQFNNTDAIRAYMGIGEELVEQAGDRVDGVLRRSGNWRNDCGCVASVEGGWMQGADCGAGAGGFAGAYHGERRGASRGGDRRGISAAAFEGWGFR